MLPEATPPVTQEVMKCVQRALQHLSIRHKGLNLAKYLCEYSVPLDVTVDGMLQRALNEIVARFVTEDGVADAADMFVKVLCCVPPGGDIAPDDAFAAFREAEAHALENLKLDPQQPNHRAVVGLLWDMIKDNGMMAHWADCNDHCVVARPTDAITPAYKRLKLVILAGATPEARTSAMVAGLMINSWVTSTMTSMSYIVMDGVVVHREPNLCTVGSVRQIATFNFSSKLLAHAMQRPNDVVVQFVLCFRIKKPTDNSVRLSQLSGGVHGSLADTLVTVEQAATFVVERGAAVLPMDGQEIPSPHVHDVVRATETEQALERQQCQSKIDAVVGF